MYDYSYYRSQNADLRAAFGNDANAYLQHFVNYGMAEGRQGRAGRTHLVSPAMAAAAAIAGHFVDIREL